MNLYWQLSKEMAVFFLSDLLRFALFTIWLFSVSTSIKAPAFDCKQFTFKLWVEIGNWHFWKCSVWAQLKVDSTGGPTWAILSTSQVKLPPAVLYLYLDTSSCEVGADQLLIKATLFTAAPVTSCFATQQEKKKEVHSVTLQTVQQCIITFNYTPIATRKQNKARRETAQQWHKLISRIWLHFNSMRANRV